MMEWLIEDILTATGGRLLYGSERQRFQGVGIDSRTIEPAALFVALRGLRHDAHAFASQVVARGIKGLVIAADTDAPLDHDDWKAQGVACVAVAETTVALGALAAFQRQQHRIPVAAITGSNGKTTTRQMTAAVMARKFKTLATEGNLNNEIGLPLTLFQLDATHQAAVLELGINHFGEMDRLGTICKPTMGMITNAGPAHLEFLENLEGVARAKGELLAHIEAEGHAILNADDAKVAALAARAHCPVVFFGTAPQADIRAESIVETRGHIDFDLILPGERLTVKLNTPGRFMVTNALAAAAVGHVAGVGIEAIGQGLASFYPAKGRLQMITTELGVKIIDDTYNANPASMVAAMQAFATARASARGLIVLGEMLELGAQAGRLHREVGVLAGRAGAVRIYAYGEHAEEVISGARDAGMPKSDLMAATKEEIAAHLIEQLRPGDWVLVKGSRGVAMESVVKAIRDWAEVITIE